MTKITALVFKIVLTSASKQGHLFKRIYRSDCLFVSCFLLHNVKMNRPEVFCKKSVITNFTKFTRKHLWQSLFFNKVAGLGLFLNKIAGLRPVTLLKKRFWHSCFPVNFVKFLRTPFFTAHLWWLLLCLFKSRFGSAFKVFNFFNLLFWQRTSEDFLRRLAVFSSLKWIKISIVSNRQNLLSNLKASFWWPDYTRDVLSHSIANISIINHSNK